MQANNKLDVPLTEEEAEHLLELKERALVGNSRQLHTLRRELRHRLLKIRTGRLEYDKGTSKYCKAQFDSNMDMTTFTFNWDLSLKDPLTLIRPFED